LSGLFPGVANNKKIKKQDDNGPAPVDSKRKMGKPITSASYCYVSWVANTSHDTAVVVSIRSTEALLNAVVGVDIHTMSNNN